MSSKPLLCFNIKVRMRYVIVSGNIDRVLEINHDVIPAFLHFRRRIREPRTYDLEIIGYSTDPQIYKYSMKDPFTLRVRLIITN